MEERIGLDHIIVCVRVSLCARVSVARVKMCPMQLWSIKEILVAVKRLKIASLRGCETQFTLTTIMLPEMTSVPHHILALLRKQTVSPQSRIKFCVNLKAQRLHFTRVEILCR